MNKLERAVPMPRLPCRTAEEPARVRSLGCVERFFHLYASSFPVHFCLVAEIGGAVGLPGLQMALEQVRWRHPALRVCIRDEAETGPAFYTTDHPIELRAFLVGADADWRRAVESELDRPFDASSGPLVRATALLIPDGGFVVLTFHHAVADALSGAHIIDDLMRALAGDTLGALPFCPPLETMIGRPAWPSASEASDAPPAAIDRPAMTPVTSAAESLAAHVSVLQWSRDETTRLVRSCRANQTTVHAAICTALSRLLPVEAGEALRLHSPMDLRPLAGLQTAPCGVFIGASVVEVTAGGQGSFWQDARAVLDDLRVARSRFAVRGMLDLMEAAFPPTASKDSVAAFFASQPRSAAVVSNLGVLPLASHHGRFRLEAVWGPIMLTNPPVDRQTIGIGTFAGQLRMVHQSYRPVFGLLDALRRSLSGSCP